MAEVLIPKWRGWIGAVTSMTYWFSAMALTAVAQDTRDWRTFQLITSLVCLWFIPYYW